MPEGVGYGPQSTASIGNNLNYLGRFVYAYSGYVGVDNTETSVLKFRTGNGLIRVDIVLNYSGTNQVFSEDFAWKVKMNGKVIMGLVMLGAGLESPPQYFPMLIPSYTEMDFTAANVTDSDTRNMSVLLSGTLHK